MTDYTLDHVAGIGSYRGDSILWWRPVHSHGWCLQPIQ